GCDREGDLDERHEPETHLIPLVLREALRVENGGDRGATSLTVFGDDYPTPDGTCIRDYIHVEDLAEAHLLALERLEAGRGLQCNLGTGRGYSVREVIRTCEEVTGLPIKVLEGPRRAGDPPVLVASPERAMNRLGWRPTFP